MIKQLQTKLSSQPLLASRNRIRMPGNSPAPWLAPLGIVLLITFFYPVVDVIRMSFTDASLIEEEFHYTINSFWNVFTLPGFLEMLKATGIFVSFSVFFQMFCGFLIALLVDQGTRRKLKGTVLVRTAVLTAWAIPGVIIGVIWKMLFNESEAGILTHFLVLLGFEGLPFLSDPNLSLISLTIANIWRGTAFSMILLYAALQTMPQDVLEAAKIDGAGPFKRLVSVIFPMMLPMVLINLALITVQTFNAFDMIMTLTGGGPGKTTEVIALNIYRSIFSDFSLGQGAATAVLLLGINLLITFGYLKMLRRQGGI